MTQKEFFRVLKEGMKPTAAVVFKIRYIAGRLRIQHEEEWYCPLTFVCKQVTGVHYFTGEWDTAAAELHMSVNVARRIVNAADNYHVVGKLRQELDEACNWPE